MNKQELTILVIDANAIRSSIIEAGLRQAGHSVEVAGSLAAGREAIARDPALAVHLLRLPQQLIERQREQGLDGFSEGGGLRARS